MGHNDHINFDLLDAFALLIDEGYLEEDSDLHKLGELVAEEGFLTPAEAAIYERDMLPLLAKVDDIRRQQYIEYILSKDD